MPPVARRPVEVVASDEVREEMLEVLWRLTLVDLSEGSERWKPSAGCTGLSIETVDERTVRRLMAAAAERSGWRLLVDVEAACLTSRCIAGAESVGSMSTEDDVVGLTEKVLDAQWIGIACR